MAPQSNLYREALAKFRERKEDRYKDTKDRQILNEFLGGQATPEEAQKKAQTLKDDAGGKYGSRKVGSTEIPQAWIDNILSNIGNFIKVGDYATKGAPESVGLAWYAVRLTLSAIQNNYELYNFFGTGLSDISEIMIIIPHYDRLYDERDRQKAWKPNALVEQLFSEIKDAYFAVLDFSLSIKRHLEGGFTDKLRHSLKDIFGLQKSKFQGKLTTIATLKQKILVDCDAAFQARALDGIESIKGMRDVVGDISSTVAQIKAFQPELRRMHDEQLSKLNELEGRFAKFDEKLDGIHEDIRAWAKPKTPWEIAVNEFAKNKADLKPMKDTSDQFLALASGEGRLEGTYEWVFDYYYTQWLMSPASGGLLCVTGGEGTGKSTLMSVIANKFSAEAARPEIFYVSCTNTSGAEATAADGGAGPNASLNASSVWNTLLFQLYVLARDDDAQDTSLLELCNQAFQNPKVNTTKPTDIVGGKQLSHSSHRDEDLPDFASTFKKLVDLIKVNALIVIDAADSLPKKEQEGLARNLHKLLDTFNTSKNSKLHMLVGSVRSIGIVDSEQESLLTIDMPRFNNTDIELKLSAQLKEVPGLSAEEQKIAKEVIASKAGSIFSYIDRAIKFMREPFQRPIENHLKSLPETGTKNKYNEELRRMGPNYVRLLHRALTWSVLGIDWPMVEVVMEDFNGVYNSNISPGADNKEESSPGFPPPSALDMEQLTEASGSFFSLSPFGESRCIWVQDFDPVRAYCFEEPEAEHEDGEGKLCARCRSEILEKKSLYISQKEGHLDLAITCLQHLNNSLFQRRAGLVQDEALEDADVSNADADDSKAEVEADQPGEVNETTEAEKTEEQPTDSAETDKAGAVEKGEDKADDGYDSDDSLDDEDRNNSGDEENFWNDQSNTTDLPSRYEVQYWAQHVRAAEDLWTPEERASSPSWATLFEELDKLVYESRPIFNAWQKKYNHGDHEPYLKEPRKPIHVAAYLGLVSWVEHLITKRGEDVNEISGNHNALQAAISGPGGTLGMLKLLLEKNADIMAETDEVEPAFHTWLNEDPSLESVSVMIEHGAKPALKSKAFGWTALHEFAIKGTDSAALDLLVSKGGDINAQNSTGYTPLLLLLRRREVPQDLLRAFIAHSANVNAEEVDTSIRPLQMASLWGDLAPVKILLEAGIEAIDDEDDDGDTALHQAAMGGHVEVVRFLAEKGAQPSYPNKRHRTALHSAAWLGYTDTVGCLFEMGAKPNAIDKHGRTPFFFACLGRLEDTANLVLDKLLELKLSLAEINRPTLRKRTPLRQAASHGFNEVVKKLINAAKAEPDLSGLALDLRDTKKSMTALHRAALNGHLETVKLLLDAGADTKLPEASGKTALVLAYGKWALTPTSDIEEIVSLLVDKDPEFARSDTELAAICAVNGSKKLLMQLHAHGVDLNRPDRYRWMPLDLARKFGQSETEVYLKQYSAWTGMLPSRWEKAASQNTNISEDGLKVSHTSKERVCLTTDKPLPPGLERYYFEVTLHASASSSGKGSPSLTRHGSNFTPPQMAIGFCTLDGTSIDYPGWPPARAPSARSWGYHSDDGGMFASSNATGSSATAGKEQRYWPGDTVGCGADLSRNTLWFTHNGKKWDFVFENVRGRLFPVLGLRDDMEVETNFFGPFKWADGEEVVDEIAQSVQSVQNRGN